MEKASIAPMFNLLDEPWIKCSVVDERGTIREHKVSLKDVFRQAHTFMGLSGESPIQDVAVMRLLLAILHAVYTRTDEYRDLREEGDLDGALRMWRRLYEAGEFDVEAISTYLEQWRDRFYLVHPTRPFYQIPAVKQRYDKEKDKSNKKPKDDSGKDKGKGDYKVGLMSVKKFIFTISESNNIAKIFLPRTDTDVISFDEALRWLLTINAADDVTYKGGVGAGWVGNIGNTMLSGDNLFETLMLNFVLYDRMREEPFWGDGLAPWELDVPRYEKCANYACPDNQVELLTLQSRRLYLRVEDGGVVGCYNAPGDCFGESEDVGAEQFTKTVTTTVSRVQIRKSKTLSNPQHLWRGFASVVASDVANKETKAGVLRWLDELLMSGMCEQRKVGIELTQVAYGNKRMKIDDVWRDTFHLNTGIFTDVSTVESDEDDWLGVIYRCLETIKDLASEYRMFVFNMAKSRGFSGTTDEAKDMLNKAQAELYGSLGESFHEWLGNINPEVDTPESKGTELVLSARDFIRGRADKLYTQAGGVALKGKVLTEDNYGNAINSVCAYNKFKYKFYNILKKGGYIND